MFVAKARSTQAGAHSDAFATDTPPTPVAKIAAADAVIRIREVVINLLHLSLLAELHGAASRQLENSGKY